jgi:hypothetical protein
MGSSASLTAASRRQALNRSAVHVPLLVRLIKTFRFYWPMPICEVMPLDILSLSLGGRATCSAIKLSAERQHLTSHCSLHGRMRQDAGHHPRRKQENVRFLLRVSVRDARPRCWWLEMLDRSHRRPSTKALGASPATSIKAVAAGPLELLRDMESDMINATRSTARPQSLAATCHS